MVIFHFRLIPGGASGFVGVDIFFVISGFLITGIINGELQKGRFSFGSFYLHRIRRLAPALFAVQALVIGAGILLLFPTELVELSRQALASQFYFANFYYWTKINYFGLKSDDVLLLHTWSLAVEEQFYLVFPLAFFIANRWLRRHLLGVLIAVCLGSFFLNLWFVGSKPEATFYLLPTRAWELLVGSIANVALMHWRPNRSISTHLGLLGLGLLAFSVLAYQDGIRFPGLFALAPTIGAVCLIGAGSEPGNFATRVLSVRPLVYVGKISYPLYLAHWPINVFAKQALGVAYSISIRFLMLLLSIALSVFIYHAIERPFRSAVLALPSRRIVFAYLGGLVTTILAVIFIERSEGLPQRFPNEVARLASFVNDRDESVSACEFTGRPMDSEVQFCRIGAKDQKPEWLVFGDSHAMAAYAAFDKWLVHRGQAGLFAFRNSCPPVMGIHILGDRGICANFNSAIFAFLGRDVSILNVMLASTWRQAVEARLSTSSDLRLSQVDSVGLFEKQFSASLRMLHGMGKQIYIWEPVPGARENVPIALARAALRHVSANIAYTRQEYLSEYAFFFRSEQKDAGLIARSFSPSTMLCADGICKVSVEGNPIYSDNSHITRSSADYWSRMLIAQDKWGDVSGR